jgi:putative nucleotidyltransferase with HDIG domain
MVTGLRHGRQTPVSDALLLRAIRRAVALAHVLTGTFVTRAVATGLFSVYVGLLLSPGITRSIPRYGLGQFTTAAVRAPYDFTVIDEDASRRRREEEARLVPPVATLDAAQVQRIDGGIRAAFSTGGAPFAESDRRRAVSEAEQKRLSARQLSALKRERSEEADRYLAEQLPGAVASFERAMDVQLTPAERDMLIKARFSGPLAEAVVTLVDDAYRQPIAEDLDVLKQAVIGDSTTKNGPGRLAIRDRATGAEQVVAQPLPIRALSQVLDALPSRAEAFGAGFDAETRGLLVRLAGAQIKANLSLDPSTTAARRTAAAEAAMPVSLNFKRNQLIIGEGQEVTAQTLLALDYLRERGMPRAYLSRAFGTVGFLFLLVTIAFWVADLVFERPRLRRLDFTYVIATLALAATMFWLWRLAVDGLVSRDAGIPEMALVLVFPFAAISMLTRFVLGFEAALLQLLVASVVFGLFAAFGVPLVAYTLAVGIAGAHWVAGCTRRSCILGAGLLVGLISGAGGLCLFLLSGSGWQTGSALLVVGGACLGGLLVGPAVVALSPVVEWAFGYTTNITLLEMVSYEHPLLKRIMVEAPGTFQHSVAISLLADAAARAIGANALLVRVGALYHDVGKIVNPTLFVENQSGLNAHDRLSPQESARLIRTHVADGVRLVRAHRLGERIADFVREHHGTSPITYFLQRARQLGEAPDEADFRYQGPPPRSRETGILMIVDQVEATARTMRGRTDQEYRAMVRQTIDRIRQEGQLNLCPLTLHDLSLIEDAVVEVLAGMNHRRVEYPPQASLELAPRGGPPL